MVSVTKTQLAALLLASEVGAFAASLTKFTVSPEILGIATAVALIAFFFLRHMPGLRFGLAVISLGLAGALLNTFLFTMPAVG